MFGGNRKKGIYFRGTGEQRQYWGTGNLRKQIFDFWGTGEQANLFQGNNGTGTPWEGLYIRSLNWLNGLWQFLHALLNCSLLKASAFSSDLHASFHI